MKVKTVGVDITKYEVGVVVARFQIDGLHEGHKHLINFVVENHPKVIIFLGVPRAENSLRNALNFETRKLMVQELYPTALVIPLKDQGIEEMANKQWSINLDVASAVPFGETSILLYGSRDSFIQYYSGKYQTCEVQHTIEMDATSRRDEIISKPENSAAFRRGVIYTIGNMRPLVYPTVDVVVANSEGQVLLVRKPNERLFRFAGGFVDPTDANLEMAARRELDEETTLSALSFKYITSTLVDDDRYRREPHKIMTTLFLTYEWDQMGRAEASDDLKGGEVKWFDVHELSSPEQIAMQIMPVHRDMMLTFINKVYADKLIKNVQPRTWTHPNEV